MHDCLFCKIARGEVPSDTLYEDDEMIAFRDIAPQAPFHILLVPKAHITSAEVLTEDEGPLLGRMFSVAAQLCAKAGHSNGYRIVTNVGAEAGQSVLHLHFHVLAGRPMAWPPG